MQVMMLLRLFFSSLFVLCSIVFLFRFVELVSQLNPCSTWNVDSFHREVFLACCMTLACEGVLQRYS